MIAGMGKDKGHYYNKVLSKNVKCGRQERSITIEEEQLYKM